MTTRFFVVCLVLFVLLNAAQATESLQKRSQIHTQPQKQFQKQYQTADSLQPIYSLSGLYQLAREFDKNIRRAEYEAQAAGYVLNKEHGALLPQVDLYASGTHYSVQEPDQEDYTSANYQLRVIQPLFKAQLLHNKALAKINMQVQQLDYAIALQQLAVQLASAYFSILKQENILVSLQAEEAALHQQLTRAQLEFSAGTLSAVDLVDIEAQYRSLEAQRITQQNTLKSFYDSLGVLIGQEIRRIPYPEADDLQLEPLTLQQNLEQFLQTVTRHNLQLATAKLEVATQKARLQRAKSAHYPELQLEASHQFNETNSDQNLAATPSRVNTLALNFSLPVYRGGSSSAEVDQQQALLRKVQAEWEQTKLNVEESAKNRFRNHKSLQDTIIANKRWVDAANKSLQATQAGLASGIRNQMDLLYAQSRLFAAQRDYSAAQYDLMMNAIELSSLSGTLNTEFLTLLEKIIVIK